MQVSVKGIYVRGGRRSLDPDHVSRLADSIGELGLLNPIVVDRGNTLIAGLHRLEAVKMLGWTGVECTVSSLEGLQSELAEIDENFIRNDLSALEYGEMLLRRKEIYEMLHPETKAGAAQAAGMNRAIGRSVADKMSATSKSFVDDTAEKLKVAPRTVRRQIQTAKNLTPEAKEIMKEADTKISKKSALKLSRLEPGQQREVASLLASKEIKSIEEYTARADALKQAGMEQKETERDSLESEPEYRKRTDNADRQEPLDTLPQKAETGQVHRAGQERPELIEGPVSVSAVPHAPQGSVLTEGEGRNASLKELVAELKDPDKDCSGTPESFLEEYAAFVRKFHREIAWYGDPYYDTVYPHMGRDRLAALREMTDSICTAAESLFHKVERMMNV